MELTNIPVTAILSFIGLVTGLVIGIYPYIKARAETRKEVIEASVLLMKSYEDRIVGLVNDNKLLRCEVSDLQKQFAIIAKQNAYIPDLEAMKAQQDATILELTERVELLESALAKTARQLRALTATNKVEIGEVIDILEDLEDNLIAE